jgi:hypothetical protein
MLFKMLIFQQLFNLSDEELEYQVNDRRSFEEFVDLAVMNNKHPGCHQGINARLCLRCPGWPHFRFLFGRLRIAARGCSAGERSFAVSLGPCTWRGGASIQP